MTTMNNAEAVEAFTRTTRIIVATLAAGLLLFMAMLPIVGSAEPAPAAAAANQVIVAGLPMLTLIATAFGAAAIAASFIAPKVVIGAGLKRLAERGPEDIAVADPFKPGANLPANDTGALLQIFQTQAIIAAALVEGAGFFALIAYMLEGHALALGMAAVLIAVLLSRTPTVAAVSAWLDDQSAHLARLRRGDS